ncbi:Domain of uncharacterised function (DUF1735) [Bacteroides heparinolyticus]|uniref:Domain of uncharacterized function (DUF1735) n=1 Tax=Prevotella heparinolytica TaxID=28113 RepID=A0A449I2C8_9BACE|nr:DUF5627 domain-containing protein [Bacteroides heparinolyticus]VFB13602.1 Domain of uncharacterised function (DUF1735) [Bacteroides heparinolyticus]
MKKSFLIIAAMAGALFAACENEDWAFPDYKYSAVYFSYQSPIRTITLGEDNSVDNSLDNEHKCQIMATIGGVYKNKKDVEIGIRVDNSLCDGYTFKEVGGDVEPLPASHYTLSSDKIVIKKGEVLGGVTVNLTDAFFNDPKSTKLNYVIPVVMTSVQNADTILQGKTSVSAPQRTNAADWEVAPKDYVLYAVKYINKYDAHYLRRGVDTYSGGKTGTEVRHAAYVEKDETISGFSTVGLNKVQWERPTRNAEGKLIDSKLLLTFEESGNCSIASNSEGVAAAGSGKFVSKGDKNSWGNKDRDVLYLDYTLDYDGIRCATKDTLVVHYRGVKAEWFALEKK